MTDPPDDAVLVNGLDLLRIHHRPVTDTVRIPENVVGLLERFLDRRCHRHHRDSWCRVTNVNITGKKRGAYKKGKH